MLPILENARAGKRMILPNVEWFLCSQSTTHFQNPRSFWGAVAAETLHATFKFGETLAVWLLVPPYFCFYRTPRKCLPRISDANELVLP